MSNDGRKALQRQEMMLHLWSQGIKARKELLELEQRHLAREVAAYEAARAELFRNWLTTNGYAWCGQCDKILMPWMSQRLYRETFALATAEPRGECLGVVTIEACRGCAASLLTSTLPHIRWTGRRHVEYTFCAEPAPEGTPHVVGPDRVSPFSGRIAGIPPSLAVDR